jgi:hypothetical protein
VHFERGFGGFLWLLSAFWIAKKCILMRALLPEYACSGANHWHTQEPERAVHKSSEYSGSGARIQNAPKSHKSRAPNALFQAIMNQLYLLLQALRWRSETRPPRPKEESGIEAIVYQL